MENGATKELTIGAHEYQIRKMTPRDACWLVTKVPGIFNATKQQFAEVQSECLKVCARLVDTPTAGKMPTPVLKDDGTFAFKDLETDNAAVFKLTFEALGFNTRPLLDEADGLPLGPASSS